MVNKMVADKQGLNTLIANRVKFRYLNLRFLSWKNLDSCDPDLGDGPALKVCMVCTQFQVSRKAKLCILRVLCLSPLGDSVFSGSSCVIYKGEGLAQLLIKQQTQAQKG